MGALYVHKGVVMGALYIRGGYGSTVHKGVVMGALYIRGGYWSTVHTCKGVVMGALYIRGGYGSTIHKGWLTILATGAAIISTVRTVSGSVAVCFI